MVWQERQDHARHAAANRRGRNCDCLARCRVISLKAIVANPRRYHWIESLWSGNKTRNPPCSTSQQGRLFLFIYTKAGYRNLAVYSVWVANHDTVFTRFFDVGIYEERGGAVFLGLEEQLLLVLAAIRYFT